MHARGGVVTAERAPAYRSSASGGSIAFLPISHLHVPHNNREIYLSRELSNRGWQVHWLRPRSGTSQGVTVEWNVLEYPDLDVRGRRYILPAYLAWRLRAAGVGVLWLSGWTMRDPGELYWLVHILRTAGIQVVYDPIDPICEFAEAQGELHNARARERCRRTARSIYNACALVTCVTPQIRDLIEATGVPGDRLHVARWGTDAALFDPASVVCDLKERLGLDRDTYLAGWLGTMEPFKGLLEVILPLVERIGPLEPDIHFVIAGRGTLEPEIRAWAASRPDLPVSILPTIAYADAPGFTGSLDAYLVPTNPETDFGQSICPVKCFDALAMGTPLIVSRTQGTEFLGQHGDLVSLADFDPASFATALLARRRAAAGTHRHPGVRAYTHQTVSVGLADAIGSLCATRRGRAVEAALR